MLENMAQVQKYVYILVSQKQISFVLFTYSMSRKKRGYIYVLKLVPTVSGNGQMNCAPKVGHKVKCNGKSELFSKNSSSTDARVREKYQFNLS